MRRIVAILVGVALGSLTLLLVGVIANTIQPTPPELMDPQSPEAVAQRVAAASTFTWLTTILGLILGAFVGGFVGMKIARHKTSAITLAIGLVLSLWACYTFYVVFPKVLWVPLLMFLGVFIGSHLGGRLALLKK